jgi:NADPH-dependent glutamate synthase beta subunit-like oxidoreductase
MTALTCPVNHTIETIKYHLASGRIDIPKSQRIFEDLLKLLEDIAWGLAGETHLDVIENLLQEQLSSNDALGADLAKEIRHAIASHEEVFVSHIQTHNCSSGACVRLAPAPCQMTCPAGIDVPTYVTLIGMGKYAEAIDVIRKDNPFPWICGLVCTRPCEFMCVRGRIDTPVSIKFLKAFAAERALSQRRYKNPQKEPDKGKKVCIIGAGPGGMSAAYYLALKGYAVRIIESLPLAGGMTMIGIPRYRLPREVIDREVAMIEELGVEFVYNTTFGRDVSFQQLQDEGFEAFLFAIGAHKAFKMRIPGEDDFPQVIDAIEILKNVALGDRQLPGKKAVIIGGGNVAIDAARTCLRLGCDDVTIAYRRTRQEMPADEEEVEQAEEEGVNLSFLTIPVEIKGENGKVTGLQCQRAKLVKKEGSDRMYPVPVPGSDTTMAADVIIGAIGQFVDHQCMDSVSELSWSKRNTITVNTATMETSVPGLFAVGDAVTGPATVIEAIGGGKKAADAIDRYLSGLPQPKMPPIPVRRARVDFLEVTAAEKMTARRPVMPLLNIDRRRTTYQQVELGYSENDVREEASRCLRCDICRRCGDCVEVCRDKMKIDALQLGYFDFDHPVETDFRAVAEKCITCGACAENCPNNAMRMVEKDGERILSICGTILNRQRLIACEVCGKMIGPARYHDFIANRFQKANQVSAGKVVCSDCARKQTHGTQVPTSHL